MKKCEAANIQWNLDFNEQFTRAYDFLENSLNNIFITGKAGTGKSTLLQYFRDNTHKNIVVLAPTGVAAVNIKGETIHSFFKFKPDITPEGVRSIKIRKKQRDIYKKIDAIVIDEISMVRADLLDCVDAFLRFHGKNKKLPFGGLQMIFIGDLYQLPPVITSTDRNIFKGIYDGPYFFNAKVFKELNRIRQSLEKSRKHNVNGMEFIELEKIYRQKDNNFINLLNSIRNNSVTDEDIEILNKRCIPEFKPRRNDLYIYLTTTNALADAINRDRLNALKAKSYHYEGQVAGKFEFKNPPTHQSLSLKIDAQVMLLNNDSEGRWINGSIGKIISIQKERNSTDIIVVELTGGRRVKVTPFTWEMFRFSYDEDTKTIESETIGSFTQYPIRLAWAVTIHKSQGKTFSKVIVDIGQGTFSHGQIYVALSRCTNFEGLILKKPILKKHIFMDWRIVRFMTNYQYKISEEKCSLDEKREFLKEAIKQNKDLDILYLKPNDEKSRRTVTPKYVGQMEYRGKTYLGVEGYCFQRQEKRIFRLDRILELKELSR